MKKDTDELERKNDLEEDYEKRWYAVLADEEDNDWGTGSYDYDEAERMVRERDYYGIAVINEGNDPICEEIITDFDFKHEHEEKERGKERQEKKPFIRAELKADKEIIKITNEINIKGLEKAVEDYRDLNAGGYFSPWYGYLMCDTEDLEVWTDAFYSLGHNTWNEYHDKSIKNIGGYVEQEYGEVTVKTVQKYITEHYAEKNFKHEYEEEEEVI